MKANGDRRRSPRSPETDGRSSARADELLILVVDDNPGNLIAVEAVLQDLGRIACVSSGLDALRYLLDHDPDVMLLDVHMNDMDGYETARLIRQRERHRSTPIIFLTAVQQADSHVLRGYEAGAVDYVFKPFDPHVLRAKVRVFVELARKQRQLEAEIERRRQAEANTLELARELENRVNERTRELELANADLRGQIQVTAQLRAQIEAASRRKDEFLAVLGHELRNPLAAVANASNAMQALPPGSPRLAGMNSIVLRQVQRLTRLVDDLLDINRITRGRIELNRRSLDLRNIVEQAAHAARPVLEARQHPLRIELPAEPVLVLGDAMRLEQALTNLLDNAAKYSPVGAEVTITLSEDGDVTPPCARITVADGGPGVASDMRERVFELFTRGQMAGVEAATGFGVGLALCRQIAGLHGGTVTIAPEPGSEFILDLPLLADAHDAGPEPRSAGAAHLPPRRVLIVEDNEDAAASLELMLRAWGNQVEVAHDGPQALQVVERYVPELVLLDIGLPGMDGYEVARHLRARLGHEVRIVAATGFGRSVDRAQALDAGCDLHVTKPIAIPVLRELLARGNDRGMEHGAA